jgi:hypothetical protein
VSEVPTAAERQLSCVTESRWKKRKPQPMAWRIRPATSGAVNGCQAEERETGGTVKVTNSKLADVRKAFGSIPTRGRDARFTGRILADDEFRTHVQGVAAYQDFHLLTHSDERRKSGRVLVTSRKTGAQALVGEFSLPVVSTKPPFYFHAGGCQLIGDCLAVPAETGTGLSTLMFFDVSNPADIQELDTATRISRQRDAGAVGITNLMREGVEVWLLCAYDNGVVTFYQSGDSRLTGFQQLFEITLKEKEHQSLCLLTDTSDRAFAIGLNKTFTGTDRAVLYEVDLANARVNAADERKFDTKGGARLRWGGSLEIVSDDAVVLHCTSKRYEDGCHINSFDPRAQARRASRRAATAVKRAKRGASSGRVRRSTRRRSGRRGS